MLEILYPTILLDSFIDSISFLVNTLGFICSMEDATVLLPLFQFWMEEGVKVIRR